MARSIPTIGINTGLETSGWGLMTELRPAYWEAILHAGGLPILMPPLTEPTQLDAFLDRVDGYLMIGGDDLHAERFGGVTLPTVVPLEARREESDFRLLDRLLARRMPTLAICLACQELNVALGGAILQDLPVDGPEGVLRHFTRAREHPPLEHPVEVSEGSRLASALGHAGTIFVNSMHHQAIGRLGRGLRRTAWAPDGVTEAVEVEGQPFFLGVQWHPERMAGDPAQEKLFDTLVTKCLK
ncbi:MAG: gamma-glutamyl-gamma-aminobutyrate hydrolase family protein [bacterium]|nr:gamma-glutamyl-gamma-aminobutyrate hydrolase family protein [bacterium]